MKTCRAFILAGLVVAAGCSDQSVPTIPQQQYFPPVARDAAGLAPPENVGTMGVIDELKPQEQGLVLLQLGFDYEAPPGARFGKVEHKLAVGGRHEKLQVHVKKDTTKIWLNGAEKAFSDLKLGDQVLVVGRVTGASLHADAIIDLAAVGKPPDDLTGILPTTVRRAAVSHLRTTTTALSDATTSLCMGQDFSYTETNILEFQGCWGGPSASDDLDLPFIPLFCPLVGCFGIDRFSYTMALMGWGYAFPFRFKAEATPGLVYHVPGAVSLGIDTLPATTGAFTFAGGLGMDFGLNIDFCSFFGCYNIYTFHLSAFSMVHQATAAGPLAGHMEISEPSCPSVGIIPVDLPINPLAIGLCEDLGLNGRPFNATVTSTGASPAVSRRLALAYAPESAQVRPNAMSVSMRFDDFDWRPGMTMGLAFRFIIFGAPIYTTPEIPFGEVGVFDAVTNPFPLPGSVFTVATDPLSPVPELNYLYQPTSANLTLSVAPAETRVAFTSANLLAEGTPVTVRLSEAFDGSSITGQPVTLEASGLGGSASVVMSSNTNGAGIASFVLPVGEYRLSATYAGAATYLPSSREQTPVYVYRPTSFVIWGGNTGGIVVGERYQFWGSGWAKQIVTGSYAGNRSFQGFAIPTSLTTWENPPASSGRGPETIPDLIGVIVTTDVQERGSKTTGNIAAHAVLRVDDPPGYRSDGGHGSTGIVRATLP